MSRKPRPKHDPHALPTRGDVVEAISRYFSPAAEDTVWAAIDKLTPPEGASLEYLQLAVIVLSRGTPAELVRLCEIATIEPIEIHKLFQTTPPTSGWAPDWWHSVLKERH